MLITDTIPIPWAYRTKKDYVDKGYTFTNWGEEFEVCVKDLPPTSRIKVVYLCDFCKLETVEVKWETYFMYNIQRPSEDACKKCMSKKRKNTFINKYGVLSPSQLDGHIEKVKQTNLKKFGKEFYVQTDEYKLKAKNTNLAKYGHENPLGSIRIRNKAKETMMKRYGEDNIFKTELGRNKAKETIKLKYGVDNVFKSNDIQEKIRKTTLDKYGFKTYAESEYFLEKYKATNIERYGVPFPLQNEKIKIKQTETNLKLYGYSVPSKNITIKNKMKRTCLNKYGVENPSQVEEFKLKRNHTMFLNGTAPSSTQQRYIHTIMGGELNYPIIGYLLDIAFPDLKVYIEYDGSGHDLSVKLKQKTKEEFIKGEENRFNRLRGLGWTLIRILSKDDKLPSEITISKKINDILNDIRSGSKIREYVINFNDILQEDKQGGRKNG